MRRQLIDEKAPAIARRSDFCYPAQEVCGAKKAESRRVARGNFQPRRVEWRQESGEPESGPGQLPVVTTESLPAA